MFSAGVKNGRGITGKERQVWNSEIVRCKMAEMIFA